MNKIIVLGAGMIGSAIARELSKKHSVACADINPLALQKLEPNPEISAIHADFQNPESVKKLVSDYDLVIGAVSGYAGFSMLESVTGSGKNIVDISFFNEDPFLLDDLAKKNGAVVVTDCGVAPGMSNMIAGFHNETMKIESFLCLVGGLPVRRTWPYQYKAPFSPIDVIEEYTRTARFVEHNTIVFREALSDAEYIEFEGIGTLEAFNTDGLRTLISTMPHIPNMKEKTLRYPGHIEYMKVLRRTGFFSNEAVNINGTAIRPIDFTSKLLFPKWELSEGEEEFTVMKVVIKGTENEQEVEYTYDLFDHYNAEQNLSSMARTTGFTCCAAAELVLSGQFASPGINPPEYVARDKSCFEFIIRYLLERKVNYTVSKKHH